MPSLQQKAQQIADQYRPATATDLSWDAEQHIGRPSDLTPALMLKFAHLLAEGHYPETARKALGIPHRTFYRWRADGKRDAEQDLDTREAAFWHISEKAEGWGEIELIREAKSGKLGWQGPMTVASRRHRERWQDTEQEGNTPKVVVYIGVKDGDVQVGLSPATFASHALPQGAVTD